MLGSGSSPKAEPVSLAVVVLWSGAEHPQETTLVFKEGVIADIFGLEPFKGEMANCLQFLLHIWESSDPLSCSPHPFSVLSASGLGDSSLQVGPLPCNWLPFSLCISRASFTFCFQALPFFFNYI